MRTESKWRGRNCRVLELPESVLDARRRSLAREAISPSVARSRRARNKREKGTDEGEKKRETKREIDWAREASERFRLFHLFSSFSLSLSAPACFSTPNLHSLTDVPDPAGDEDGRHGWRELGGGRRRRRERGETVSAEKERKGDEEERDRNSERVTLFGKRKTAGIDRFLSLRHALFSGFCPLWAPFLHSRAFSFVARHTPRSRRSTF